MTEQIRTDNSKVIEGLQEKTEKLEREKESLRHAVAVALPWVMGAPAEDLGLQKANIIQEMKAALSGQPSPSPAQEPKADGMAECARCGAMPASHPNSFCRKFVEPSKGKENEV